jgi:hypothetical protein
LLRRAADPRISFIETAQQFQNPDGTIRYFNSVGAMYRDNNHLNPAGVMEIKPLLEPFFRALAF